MRKTALLKRIKMTEARSRSFGLWKEKRRGEKKKEKMLKKMITELIKNI